MGVTVISSYDQFKTVINGEKPVLIDFWATWCGPCRIISPIFEKLSAQFDDLEFYKVDVDEQGEISKEVGIRAMPTFTLFHKGTKVKDLVGANPSGLEALVKHGKTLV